MRYHSLWLCIGLLIGCSQSDDLSPTSVPHAPQPDEPTAPLSLIRDCLSRQAQNGELSYRVSQREAMILANILDTDTDDCEVEYLTYESDTLMYVLNSSNGWKLLSSDKRTQPVLAYGESGRFSIDSLNPGEAIWLDEMAEQLYEMAHDEEMAEDEEEYIEEADPAWVDLAPAMASANTYADGEWVRERTVTYPSRQEVAPLTQTQWHQKSPWNLFCPMNSSKEQAVAGCVAIAGAQMLYYLHYLWGIPAEMFTYGYCKGTLSNYEQGFSAPSPEAWDLMAKTESGPGSEYAAILIGLTGQAVGMKYGLNSSSAKTEDLKGFFKEYFGIKSSYSDYKVSTVFQSLDQNIPVIVKAYGARTNRFLGLIYTYEDGHAWIIDGYRQDEQVTEITYRWHTYYTTPDDDEEDWEEGKGPVKGDDWEIAVDEEAEEEAEEEEDGGNAAARPKRISRRPTYPTGRTYTQKTTAVTGRYVHMNWGWGGNDNKWYVANGKWDPNSNNYKWKRHMLVITGHN